MDLKNVTTSVGRDVLGVYEETTFFMIPDELNFKLSLRAYEGDQVLVLKQEFSNFEVIKWQIDYLDVNPLELRFSTIFDSRHFFGLKTIGGTLK